MLPGISGFAGWATAPGTSGGGGIPTSDPYWSNVVLLLSGDGANASTTFTDESPITHGNATVNGNTQVTTTTPKFGSGSILMDGTGDSLTYADAVGWGLSNWDFTLEGWYWFDNDAAEAERTFLSHYDTSVIQRSWAFRYRGDLATNQLEFVGSTNGSTVAFTIAGNWSPTTQTWHHICCDRSGNAFRIYVDGALVASGTNSGTLYNSDASLRIGNIQAGGETSYFKGKMDEIRITKGVARYASDSGFSVPTAAFPRS